MSVRVDDNGFPVAEVRYPTPGPVSVGDPEAVAAQRADLGLGDDPTGESDASGAGKLGDPVEPAADESKPADPVQTSSSASSSEPAPPAGA